MKSKQEIQNEADEIYNHSKFNVYPNGISKREYFFASAIQGLCANESKNTNSPEFIVDLACKITDEAMKVLEKEK